MDLKHETAIRVGSFVGVLLAMALLEFVVPRRKLATRRPLRWLSNLGLVAVNALLLRFALPLTAVSMALIAEDYGFGLFQSLQWPAWLEFVLAVIALDFVIYLQHVMFHAVPALWRLHMVHHADLDFDVTTGLRFHSLEILLSMGLKIATVAALGCSPWAVIAFEALLNATSMFNHANVRLALWLDRLLRLIVVTPDMHRVHHSVIKGEANSNFGFNLPWWDWLLGTYRDQPSAGHEQMTIGVSHLRDERQTDRLHWMLLLPFTGGSTSYPVNERESAR
jgi:sterol desaturase/sphingolipid hydroxylase (fatty acid hydroxylase superfamily)